MIGRSCLHPGPSRNSVGLSERGHAWGRPNHVYAARSEAFLATGRGHHRGSVTRTGHACCRSKRSAGATVRCPFCPSGWILSLPLLRVPAAPITAAGYGISKVRRAIDICIDTAAYCLVWYPDVAAVLSFVFLQCTWVCCPRRGSLASWILCCSICVIFMIFWRLHAVGCLAVRRGGTHGTRYGVPSHVDSGLICGAVRQYLTVALVQGHSSCEANETDRRT